MKQIEQHHNGVVAPSSSLRPGDLATLAAAARPHGPLSRERKTRRQDAAPCMTHDVWIYRIVVSAFAAVLLITTLGVLLLALSGKELSQASGTLFIALASGAIGALTGLLAPSPKG